MTQTETSIEKLTTQAEWFLVGAADGRIVATCMAGYDGHRGWVNYLSVTPAMRHRGLGRKMMQAVEEQLRAVGCPKINLQVRDTNTVALGFYEALGYAVDRVTSLGKRLIDDHRN